jgi:two-component system NtrC family sensor kinase
MLATPDARRALGAPVASRPMGWPIIPVARRAPALPGLEAAPGIVVSSFSPDALAQFYASVAEGPHDVVALFREDGAVLARHPADYDPGDAAIRPRIAAMLEALLAPGAGAAWVDSPVDGRRRFFVARRVGEWPAAVAYGVDRAAMRAAWRARMVGTLLGGIAATGLLLAVATLAERGARLQHEQAESRAEAEAQLARAGRAASLGLLAAGLAHDVKNLVQAVRSGARLMERSANDAAEVRHCSRLLADAAERGGRLVDGMLAFARGGAAEDASDHRLDVATTLRGLSELLGRTLGSAWQVRTTLPEGLPVVRGDQAGFEAAVVNLAANARDAMPAGGVVRIAARKAVVAEGGPPGGLKPGEYVVTTVRDTGLGMDAATLARLGEPFFTTKPPGIGTGLGLATVRGFCARAGGALRVESTPGRGTTAAIWLPVA